MDCYEPITAIDKSNETPQERYFSTVPSAKINDLLKYMPLKYDSLKLYDECSQSSYPLVMICLASPYYVPFIEFEIQFYISNYDESKAKDIWLHKVKSLIKTDDITTFISLRVGDDIPAIAKILTYYLRALNIDISKLIPVWQ